MQIENYLKHDTPEKLEEYSYEEELLLNYSDYLENKCPNSQQ